MQIDEIAKQYRQPWDTCEAEVIAGASQIRGWPRMRQCESVACWIVDGKKYCTRHKNKLAK